MYPMSDGSNWWAAADYVIPPKVRSQVTSFSCARVLVAISLWLESPSAIVLIAVVLPAIALGGHLAGRAMAFAGLYGLAELMLHSRLPKKDRRILMTMRSSGQALSPPKERTSDAPAALKERQAEESILAPPGRYAADERSDCQTPNPFDGTFAYGHPLRILVAENKPINQVAILAMLRRLGYEAELATHGGEVLVALERAQFDLVLLDMHMPVMDGLSLAQRIKARPPRQHAPELVAVTASVLPEQREAYRAAGILRLIAKPVQAHELRKVLERAVGVPDSTAA